MSMRTEFIQFIKTLDHVEADELCVTKREMALEAMNWYLGNKGVEPISEEDVGMEYDVG